MVMRCQCGRKDCVTRIYVDDIPVPGITVIFNPGIDTDEDPVHLAQDGQLLIPADDAALTQLIKDLVFILRVRADKRLRAETGLE